MKAIRGFKDILPAESALWRHIESEAFRVFSTYGFSEIRLPILEKTELFSRSIGEGTDIVEKEMYSFKDRRGDGLTLRPEGTAPAVRAYIENKLHVKPVTKLYYTGPMFRYERPQKGRYRQFYQIGAEVLGDADPKVDAETIEMLIKYFRIIGIKDAVLNINSLGCSGCRPGYKLELLRFLGARMDSLCENCQRRVEENPLRALDCKSQGCVEATEDAPSMVDQLCRPCFEHFEGVTGFLMQLDVNYVLNSRMVRGLDYYTRTTFEITGPNLGAQNTIAAGGRYDKLVSELGGPDTPCFGFAIGMERLSIVLSSTGGFGASLSSPIFFFVSMGKPTRKKAMALVAEMRDGGFRVETAYIEGSPKKAMKRADKLGAVYTIILGEDELSKGVVSVKEMATADQSFVPYGELILWLNATLTGMG